MPRPALQQIELLAVFVHILKRQTHEKETMFLFQAVLKSVQFGIPQSSGIVKALRLNPGGQGRDG